MGGRFLCYKSCVILVRAFAFPGGSTCSIWRKPASIPKTAAQTANNKVPMSQNVLFASQVRQSLSIAVHPVGMGPLSW
jgi:hypothetical protein